MKLFSTFLTLFLTINLKAQNIGIGTPLPNSSAILDVSSSTKGFLPPRIFLASKTDVITIANPASGLMVYNTNPNIAQNGCCAGMYMFNGTVWKRLLLETDDILPTALFTSETGPIRQFSNQRYQSFTATQTGILSSVSILTSGAYGGTGIRPIKLYTGNGNAGTLLATYTLPGNTSGSQTWETATLPTTQINIYAGLSYTIETSEFLWVFLSGNPYLEGYSNSTFNSTDDYGFKILVKN